MRLAKEHGLDSELTSFALQSSQAHMLDAAEYFEKKGAHEKAVQLYQKGGDVAKALDICFKAGAEGRATMFEVLNNIATNLSGETSPAVLARCSEFFLQHEQYEQAVKLCVAARVAAARVSLSGSPLLCFTLTLTLALARSLARARARPAPPASFSRRYVAGKRFTQAIQLCADYRVKLTDEIAESLTPPKEGEGAPKTKEERNEVLAAIARAAKKGGLYQLACKKCVDARARVARARSVSRGASFFCLARPERF